MVKAPNLNLVASSSLSESSKVGQSNTRDYNKRIQRWEQEEILCLLRLLKEFELYKQSCLSAATQLQPLMAKEGWSRNIKQIQQKITGLRKKYLNYVRSKLLGVDVKECPFISELGEVYSELNYNNLLDDGFDSDSNSNNDMIIRFPGDTQKWRKGEVQNMLNYALESKLEKLPEEMGRSMEQIKNALSHLKAHYVEYKQKSEINDKTDKIIFLKSMESLWGDQYRSKFWAPEETVFLLTIIRNLNYFQQMLNHCKKAVEEVQKNLKMAHYSRSEQEIMDHFDRLTADYGKVSKLSENAAFNIFPFHSLYKKLFETKEERKDVKNTEKNEVEKPKDLLLNEVQIRHNLKDLNDETLWIKREVKLLIETIKSLRQQQMCQELTEDDYFKLQDVLERSGFYKTIEDIKVKLEKLKFKYQKCNLEDSDESNVYNCPFYNDLHDIYRMEVSEEKYRFIQNVLSVMESATNDTKFLDHNYDMKTLEPFLSEDSIIDDRLLPDSTLKFEDFDNQDQNRITNAEDEDSSSTGCEKASEKSEEHNFFPPKDLYSQLRAIFSDSSHNENGINNVNEENLSQDWSEYLNLNEVPNPKKRKVEEDKNNLSRNRVLLRPVDMNATNLNVTNNTKFVRLTVSGDSNKNKKCDQIMVAHIEPIASSNSLNSGKSVPVDCSETVKPKNTGQCEHDDVCKTIKESTFLLIQQMHQMQHQHHIWMEKQLENQRKHDESHKSMVLEQLRELRNIVSLLVLEKLENSGI